MAKIIYKRSAQLMLVIINIIGAVVINIEIQLSLVLLKGYVTIA